MKRLPRPLDYRVVKSSRHSRIAGDFGEGLILYWLSRTGHEVCRVDHTGIDLLAYDPKSRRRLGISVKSRTRSPGLEAEGVYIRGPELELITEACRAYAATPFLGIVLDRYRRIEFHAVRLDNAIEINGRARTLLNFKVGTEQIARYRATPGYFGLTLSYQNGAD